MKTIKIARKKVKKVIEKEKIKKDLKNYKKT